VTEACGRHDLALEAAHRSSIFSPDRTNMANIAHFMGELVTIPNAWETWKGKLPVIINAPAG
jgi:hypothetical protein